MRTERTGPSSRLWLCSVAMAVAVFALPAAAETCVAQKQFGFKAGGSRVAVKPGMTVEVLGTKGGSAEIRVGTKVGRVRADALQKVCPINASPPPSDDASGDAAPVDAAPAPEQAAKKDAPRGSVLLLPFTVSSKVSAEEAGRSYDRLAEVLRAARSDVVVGSGRFGREPLKKHLAGAIGTAAKQKHRYVVTGALGRDRKGDLILSVALVDATRPKILKALNARPSGDRNDPWADIVVARFSEDLPAPPAMAPVAVVEAPKTPKAPPKAAKPTPAVVANAEPAPSVVAPPAESAAPTAPAVAVNTTPELPPTRPWYATGVPYFAAGGSAAALAGGAAAAGAVAGSLAWLDKVTIDGLAQVDPQVDGLVSSARNKAAVADGMYIGAAVLAASAAALVSTGVVVPLVMRPTEDE